MLAGLLERLDSLCLSDSRSMSIACRMTSVRAVKLDLPVRIAHRLTSSSENFLSSLEPKTTHRFLAPALYVLIIYFSQHESCSKKGREAALTVGRECSVGQRCQRGPQLLSCLYNGKSVILFFTCVRGSVRSVVSSSNRTLWSACFCCCCCCC